MMQIILFFSATFCSFDGDNAVDGSQCGWREDVRSELDEFNWIISSVQDGVSG